MNTLSRRSVLVSAWFPFFFWRKRTQKIADIRFRIVRRGSDRRRYLWIHGDETTARDVLLAHMTTVEGRAFMVENDVRTVPLAQGQIDPNRLFSRLGAERNLLSLNPTWSAANREDALKRLDRDRDDFLRAILPKNGRLMIALHNNSRGYSVKDEIAVSNAVSLKDAGNPHEFMLCTNRADYDRLALSPFNVVLQDKPAGEEDGSLSRLAALRGVRYVNIEAWIGNREAQRKMLAWVEKELPVL